MNPTYHNPDNLPSPGEGWRFLVEGERKQPGDQWWWAGGKLWEADCEDELTLHYITYRTRRPLPIAPDKGPQTCTGCGAEAKHIDFDGARCEHCTPPSVAVAQTEAGTPRTDAAVRAPYDPDGEYAPADFARTLERELAAARRELEEAKGERDALVQSLNKYGTHFRVCLSDGKCSCGLDPEITRPNDHPEVSSLRRQLEEAQRERDNWMQSYDVAASKASESCSERDALLTHAEALARALEKVQEEAQAPTSVSEEYDPTPTATERLRRTASLSVTALAAYRAHQSSQQEVSQ